MRLHAPNDGAVAVLVCDHLLFLIRALGKLRYLAVGLFEDGQSAAYRHVVGLGIQSEVRAEDLRIGGLVHFKPLQTALRCVVYASCALEVVSPVPLFARVLLDEGNGVANFLRGVFLNVLVNVTQRGGKLENRDAVLKLHAL